VPAPANAAAVGEIAASMIWTTPRPLKPRARNGRDVSLSMRSCWAAVFLAALRSALDNRLAGR